MLYPTNSRWNKFLTSGSDMTVRRSRFASVPPPGYFSSTKGHSALRKWSYFPPSRAATYSEDIGYYPDFVRPRTYDTTREENEIRRDVNSELMYTSNLMDDTYDIAARSRNRDQTLLRDATRALVDTETYSSPRSSATSRRVRQTSVVRTPAVARAVSCPPVRASNQVVVLLTSPASQGGSRVFITKSRASAVREQSMSPTRSPMYPRLTPSELLERRVDARRIVNTTAGSFLLPSYHPYQSMYQPYISLYRPLYTRRYLATVNEVPTRRRRGVAVLAPPLRRKIYRKAALVGNKVEVVTPRRRHPRSAYAANKMREMKRDEREMEVEAVPIQSTTSLKASTVSSVRY